MSDTPSRKLAVILHADVVGSTALVQANETLAHQRIRDTFRRFSEAISVQGGASHEVRGDAHVAEFPSASDAVEAALSFQASNTTYLNDLPDEIKPVIRVGIAMGEVVVGDDTVTGEAVVLAQRLEQLAQPAGICIQAMAKDTIPKRLPYIYEDLGEQAFKGFGEPVLAYTISQASDTQVGETEPVTQSELVYLELPDEPSIAVLPFSNMSGDPEQEYFSDGITEDIITALSKVSSLMVVARTSTFTYKDRAIDIKQVGREQGVRYVVEGSVRRAGDRVRVTAQLIDAVTGHHIWAERYDRELHDIFAVQDELVREIVTALDVELREGEQHRMWSSGTDNLEAWECVQLGQPIVSGSVPGDGERAKKLFERASELDPNYAMAWVMLGWYHFTFADVGGWRGRCRTTQACTRLHAEVCT